MSNNSEKNKHFELNFKWNGRKIMMFRWITFLSLMVFFSCSEQPKPKAAQPGQIQKTSTPEGLGQDQTQTQTQPQAQDAKKDETQQSQQNSCQINEKFTKIFDLVYALSKTKILGDAGDEVSGVLEILKLLKDSMGTLQTSSSYENLAAQTSTLAKQKFTELSDEEKAAIDVGLLAVMKALNQKCNQNAGDFSINDVISFASDVVKVLPKSLTGDLGDFDLESILTIAKTLGVVLDNN